MSANTTTPRGVAQPGTAGAAIKPAAGASGASSASPEDATGQEAEGQNEQGVVSREVFEQMKRQTAGQSALLRRLTAEIDELKARQGGKGAEAGEEGDGKKQYKSPYMRQLAELNEFKAKLEVERSEMLEDVTKQNLYNGLVAKGVNPKLASLATESLLSRVRGKVSSSKDTLGRMLLELKGDSPEEESIPLDSWLEAFIGSDEGKSLLPAEPNPTLRGVPIRRGGTTEGKIRITKEQMRTGQFNMEDMAAGKITVMDA